MSEISISERHRRGRIAAVLTAIARHEVDAIVVQSLHHLGSSVEPAGDQAKLHRHGVAGRPTDHADLVETGGLFYDFLVEPGEPTCAIGSWQGS